MIVNGIVAEYNPFHKGHQYQLEDARRATGADYTVVVMSGNFVQRGAPAIIDKYTRTKMALSCGADLVLELPVYYACASAEYFAEGAVSLLDQLGAVDHLCFGSEEGSTDNLDVIARILAEEPEEYTMVLRDNLRKGLSFPTARMQALSTYDESLKEKEALLASPNNILGLEYLKTLYKRSSSMKPYTTQRQGAGYHDVDPGSQLASATAIRHLLIEHWADEPVYNNITSFSDTESLSKQMIPLLADHIPLEALNKLIASLAKSYVNNVGNIYKHFMTENSFSAQLHYKLLSEASHGFTKYLDVSEDISDRINKLLYDFESFAQFTDLLKTKDTTHTRLSRCLLHILLGITNEHMTEYRSLGFIPYARILGFRKDAAPLLNSIKKNSKIPLITKLADREQVLATFYGDAETDGNIKTGSLARRMLSEDISINRIYESAVSLQTGCPMRNEYRTPLVII